MQPGELIERKIGRTNTHSAGSGSSNGREYEQVNQKMLEDRNYGLIEFGVLLFLSPKLLN